MRSLVVNRQVRGAQARLRLENGENIDVHRYATVGRKDTVVKNGSTTWIALNSASLVPLTPGWCFNDSIEVDRTIDITIKEIETPADLRGYHRLARLHYRGGGGAGRRAPLVAIADEWEVPRVVGFVEIASTFIVNAARADLLNGQFLDEERGVAWTEWSSSAAKKWSSTIARISRCVVYPELRGLGLSKLLVNAAKDFAANRWHLGGMQPCFLEITAEMLRYWPFIRSSGFHYAGETQGNRHRAATDMRYLVSRRLKEKNLPGGGGGIMSAQRSYADAVYRIIKEQGTTIGEMVRLLQVEPEKLTDDQWIQLHRVYRRPKPTYIAGLTKAAEEYLENQVRHRQARGGIHKETGRSSVERSPRARATIKRLSITATSSPLKSAHARRVQEAFGIVAKNLVHTVLDNLEVTLPPGEIVLVGGPSGSGKTLLLKSICQMAGTDRRKGKLPAGIEVTGTFDGSKVRVALPRHPDPDKAPIELCQGTLEESLRLLAYAGLAEAELFVRPSRTLSLGQRYRLSIALALDERPELLLIDEFCEPLDRFTAAAVCRRLRAWCRSEHRSLIAATADPRRVAPLLEPDRVLLLSSDGSASWSRGALTE